jgi:RNA polymerase sigma-70 factor (ECF subfamily)
VDDLIAQGAPRQVTLVAVVPACQPSWGLKRDTSVNAMRHHTTSATTHPPVGAEPFDSFYAREFRGVVALAYALSGSRSIVEDLAQDAFMAAYDKWERISAYSDPGAWVRRVVANKSTSAWRRRLAEVRAIARLDRPRQQPIPLPSDAEAIWAAVRRLPRRQAQVVALRFLEDRPLDEIASTLGCSIGSVKQHLFRAKQRLAEDLSDEGGVS